MTLEGFEFQEALSKAYDYAAMRCRDCGTGNTRCPVHANTMFHDNFLERLEEVLSEQVQEVVRVQRSRDGDLSSDIGDMIGRVIPRGATTVPVADILDLQRRVCAYLDEV